MFETVSVAAVIAALLVEAPFIELFAVTVVDAVASLFLSASGVVLVCAFDWESAWFLVEDVVAAIAVLCVTNFDVDGWALGTRGVLVLSRLTRSFPLLTSVGKVVCFVCELVTFSSTFVLWLNILGFCTTEVSLSSPDASLCSSAGRRSLLSNFICDSFDVLSPIATGSEVEGGGVFVVGFLLLLFVDVILCVDALSFDGSPLFRGSNGSMVYRYTTKTLPNRFQPPTCLLFQ